MIINLHKFWDKFTDDNQLVGLKLTCGMLVLIIGEVLL